MALNREQKRALRKRGELGDDGEPTPGQRRAPSTAPRPKGKGSSGPKEARLFSVQGMREVRGELRKVAWPSRAETMNYSVVVAIALIVVTTLIFALDWVFSEAVLRIFNVK